MKEKVPVEKPHLSTMDMLRLSATLAEIDLTARLQLSPAALTHAWVSEFSVDAVLAPILDLDRVEMSATTVSTTREPGKIASSRYEVRFSRAKACITVRHPAAAERRRRISSIDVAKLLGDDTRRLYGGGHGTSAQDVRRISYDTERRSLELDVAVTGAGPLDGIEAAYWPSMSLVDIIAIGGQAAQTLIYLLDDVRRDLSNPFWLRRISCQAPIGARPLRSHGTLLTKKSSLLSRGDALWRTAQFDLQLAGVSISASVVHQLPARSG